MSLKYVEFESLSKSFLLFFTSLSFMISIILYQSYIKEVKVLDESIYTQMRICSFDLKCDQFELDFIETEQNQLYTFHKNDEGVFALFSIPNSSDYIMKVFFPQTHYKHELDIIQEEHIYHYVIVLFILFIVSFLFSLYALKPLRKALLLSDEFIKDILHDFNTPLSTLRLNSSLLKKELSENTKIIRIEQAVQTILNLQNNLRSYIDESPLQNENIDLNTLIIQRLAFFASSFPNLIFTHHLDAMSVYTNIDAMTRILDNLISNAAKYNIKEGKVDITLDATNKQLIIKDTGKGIKSPNKIFERFYKEHDRGLGIGLHIVKKLCDTLHIPITVHSKINVGSTFILDLKNLNLSTS